MMNKWLYWGMAAGLLLCACAKENGSGTAEGTPVMFSASTVETRTAYSGDVVNGYERINWTPDDQIKVNCPQASSPSSHVATYTIGGGDASGKQSEATSVTSSTPLQWGSGTHRFYGVYPASATLSVSGTTATMSGEIPASQTGSPALSSVGYMFAYQTESNPGRYQKVDLAFKPLFNAITFSLKAGDSSVAKQLSSIVLSSDNYLAGPFTASWSSATATVNEGSSDLSKSITMTTTETLSTTDALTVTFITMPITQTNLKLTMNFNDGSTWQFPLKNGGSASTLNQFEKLVFSDILVPKPPVDSGYYTINFQSGVNTTITTSTQASAVIDQGLNRVTTTPFECNYDSFRVNNSRLYIPNRPNAYYPVPALTINLSDFGQKSSVTKIELNGYYSSAYQMSKQYFTVNGVEPVESLVMGGVTWAGFLPDTWSGVMTFNVSATGDKIIILCLPSDCYINSITVYY